MRTNFQRLATTGLAGLFCVVSVQASAATVVVNMFDFDFSANPPSQSILDPTINLGDTIRWVLTEGMHSTRSSAGQLESWDSDVFMTLGDAFEYTFSNEGSFAYFCEVHGFDAGNGTASGMAGTITVVPVPEPATLMVLSLGAIGIVSRARRPRK